MAGETWLMELKSRKHPNLTVLALSGRFDSSESARMNAWFEEQTTANVIINLAEVNFVDSSALAVMVKAMKRCRGQQGELVLCNLQHTVRVIFELTRLDKAISIYDTEAEAIKAVG
jgi:anti-sigma B factor antagonist